MDIYHFAKLGDERGLVRFVLDQDLERKEGRK
jgi:hypothetical protein